MYAQEIHYFDDNVNVLFTQSAETRSVNSTPQEEEEKNAAAACCMLRKLARFDDAIVASHAPFLPSRENGG